MRYKLHLIVIITALASTNFALANAREFCTGFEQGYKTAFKSAHSSALEPVTPPCPPQPPKSLGDPESDREHGYLAGLKAVNTTAPTAPQPSGSRANKANSQDFRLPATRPFTSTASDERWMHLRTGEHDILHIDIRSLRAYGHEVTTWIRRTPVRRAWWVMSDDERIQYQHEFSRIHFNCDSWEMTILSAYITGPSGNQLAQDGEQVGPFIVSPTSLYDDFIDATCEFLNRSN